RYNMALETAQSGLQILDTNGVVISVLSIGNSSRGIFLLKNAGESIVEWEIPKLAVNWIAGFSKQSGKLAPGAVDTVMLTIDRTQLSEGSNEAVLYIGSSVGDKKLLITAGMELSFCFTDSYGNEIMDVDMSSVDQYRFKIKNTGSGALTWTVGEIEANWLTFVGERNGQLSAGESESRTLQVDRTRLEEGKHETALIFKTNAGTKSLSVKNNVEMAYRLENEYRAEITELEFGAASSQRFIICNIGNGVLTWDVSPVEADWLTLGDKKRGSLQPGAVETLTMTIDRTKLSVGDNQTTITVNTNGGEKQLQVNAHVELSYQLVNAQDEEISLLDFGRTAQGSFKIKNTGSGILEWEISRIDADWLSLSGETKGTLWPEDAATVELVLNLSKLSTGMYEAIVYIGSTGGEKQLPVRINWDIGAVGSDYEETVSGIGLQMVAVSGGVFLMGGTEEQGSDAAAREKPVHEVALDGFYIGKFTVTNAQWKAVMGEDRTTNIHNCAPGVVVEDCPVIVNWYEAQEFCSKLSELTGKKYRLPTEAEWEYAARGGQNADGTKYAGSNSIYNVAWFSGNSNFECHSGGMKSPNGLGVYDMSGNVNEWCSDWYRSDYYSSLPIINPQGPSSGEYNSRVVRGGGWNATVEQCRVSDRFYWNPTRGDYTIGFRVVCEP
ncbi:MAG: formylglycine-generating enzyme family protein, partial [Bacteroidales bacterium]|nr:formylglycine-generating enzyme family protein [Bacteroidales bacterium]